jgi:hypothetical protein
MALKRSCPAVSHTCAFTNLLSIYNVLEKNYTPIVGLDSSVKGWPAYLKARLDFPTAESISK